MALSRRMTLLPLLAIAAILAGTPPCPAHNSGRRCVFDSSVWDFGSVSEDAGPVMHSFSFRNHGTAPLTLERISVSCSCIKVYPGETSFAPGESGEILVSFSPSGLYGEQSKSVTVFVDGAQNKLTLELRGNVVNEEFDKGYSLDLGQGVRARTMDINFGNVYEGEKFVRQLPVWNTSSVPVEVVLASAVSNISIIGGEEILPGEKKDLIVVLEIPKTGDSFYGTLSRSFTLLINDFPAEVPAAVSARCIERTLRTASVKPRMEVSAKEVNLRKFFWQSSASGKFEILNSGTGELQVRKVETDGAECSLQSGTTVPAGGKVRAEVTMPGDCGTVRLFTNDPVRPYLEIQLKAD